MFGAGMQSGNVPFPEWALKVVREHIPNAALGSLHWIHHPNGRAEAYGCCYVSSGRIEIHSNTTECTKRTLKVLLHEMAHRMSPEPDIRPSGRKNYHGPSFWKVAAKLYEHHGLLEYAAEKEYYASGRKYLKKIIESRILVADRERRPVDPPKSKSQIWWV